MDRLEDADLYINEWARTQLIIWREKVERLGIVRTGALHQSFTDRINRAAKGETTINFRFLSYGIYQALGVGYGYRDGEHGNYGDLEFLDEDYRSEHGLDRPRKVGPKWGGYKTSGKPRQRRDWYSKKLYMSAMALVEDLARILGEQSAHVVCDNLTDTRSALT